MTHTIYYRISGQSKWIKFNRPITDILNASFGLGSGAYDLQVIVTDDRGAATSTIVSFPAKIAVPSRPIIKAAGEITSSSIVVNWNPSDRPVFYLPMYRLMGVGNFVQFGPPITATSTKITGLQVRTNYDIQIKVINNGGSAVSAKAAFRTALASFGDPPTVSNISETGASVTWKAHRSF